MTTLKNRPDGASLWQLQPNASSEQSPMLWLCVMVLVLAVVAGIGFWYVHLPVAEQETDAATHIPPPSAQQSADQTSGVTNIVSRTRLASRPALRPPPPPAFLATHTHVCHPEATPLQAIPPPPPNVAANYPRTRDDHGCCDDDDDLADLDGFGAFDDPDHAFNHVGIGHKDGQVLFKKRTRVHYLFVDHQNFDASTGKLSVAINLRNVTGIELHEAAMPRGAYTINPFNNQFIVNSAAHGDEVVALDEGDYTVLELQTELQVKCAATNALDSVTYDAKTQKFTFEGDAMDVAIKFPKSLLAYTLGFGTVSIWPALDANDAVVRTATVTSRNRCDLFGGRYLRVKCPDLLHSYGNTTVVAQAALANDITYVRHTGEHMRTFVEAKRLDELAMVLEVVAPNNTTRNYDPNGLAFHMTFVVRTEIMTADRSLEAVDNDVIVK